MEYSRDGTLRIVRFCVFVNAFTPLTFSPLLSLDFFSTADVLQIVTWFMNTPVPRINKSDVSQARE